MDPKEKNIKDEEMQAKHVAQEEKEESDKEMDSQDKEQENETSASEEEKLETELKALQEERDTLKDKYLRLSAEFDNYRKRTMKEKAELVLNGGEKSITSILPVVDDLERALEELERKEARMVLDGANIDDIHADLVNQEQDKLNEMNDYVRQFIVDNYENVLGPSVFMMMCSTMPYPMMTEQVEDIMRTAPVVFKENPLVRDFLDKAKENMKLLEEHKRLQENMASN